MNMISVDFTQPSTWRGVVMAVTGIAGLYYIGPEISALSASSTPDQVQFFLSKTTALASAIGLAGQTASGLIGTIFSDKVK
ncbi:MAG: hypothetical protein IPI57_20670 [Candidatus Competibacteraceae bacterium]|nr:hypothetical protein [Candidatus Competibacteraceae bacterium]